VENVTFVEKRWCCQSIQTWFPIRPITGYEGPEGEYRYSSNLSLTLALEGVVGKCYAPAALPPMKEIQYPLYRSLGGPQGEAGWV